MAINLHWTLLVHRHAELEIGDDSPNAQSLGQQLDSIIATAIEQDEEFGMFEINFEPGQWHELRAAHEKAFGPSRPVRVTR